MIVHGDVYLGVDFGGTNLRIGAVDVEGNISALEQYATGFLDQSEASECILQSIESYMNTHSWENGEVRSIGMGLVGQIDYNHGIWYKMYGIEGDVPIPIAAIIMSRYPGVICRIDNDVKTALVAERLFGYGRRSNNFVYVNIGTGIAAAAVCDGHVIRGKGNDAGEIGHYPIRLDSSAEGLGLSATIEDIASGRGMSDRFLKMAREMNCHDTVEVVGDSINISKLILLADQGIEPARRVVDDAVKAITDMLVSIGSSYDPESIILGGGVMQDKEFFRRIQRGLPSQIIKDRIEIRISQLDLKTIGLVGAAMLGKEALDEKRGDKL